MTVPDDDAFGRLLGEQLHRGAPGASGDLALIVTQRGRAVRRRRRRIVGAVVAAVVAVVVSTAVLVTPRWSGLRPADPRLTAAPSDAATSPSPYPGDRLVTVDVRPGQLGQTGPAPGTDVVGSGRWLRSDGSSIDLGLGADAVGRFVALGDDLVTETNRPGARYGPQISVHDASGAPARGIGGGMVSRSIAAGPDGSVIWLRGSPRSIVRLDADGRTASYALPRSISSGSALASTQHRVFAFTDDQVTAFPWNGAVLGVASVLPGVARVTAVSMASDLVAVTTTAGCSQVLDAERLTTVISTCTAVITAISADGAQFYGYDPGHGRGVLFDSAGRPRLQLTGGGDDAAFDAQGLLTLVSESAVGIDTRRTKAIVTCRSYGACAQIGARVTIEAHVGNPGFAIVH